MQRLLRAFPVLALLAGLAVVAFVLLGRSAEPPEMAPPETAGAPATPSAEPLERERSQGGVFAGRVTDTEGTPIHGATVVLVAHRDGDIEALARAAARRARDPDASEAPPVPVVGGYTAGGRTTSERDGSFRVAADSEARVAYVVAHHPNHFVEAMPVDGPREGIRIELARAGYVIGHVVDDVTGDPVAGARVEVLLQQKARPVEMQERGAGGALKGTPGAPVERSPLAAIVRFVTGDLAPEIWGLESRESDGLVVWTDVNGVFQVGPLGSSVQVEFVITHPEYAWHDFDSEGGAKTPQRTVVPPGETVRREFRLPRGQAIAGVVIDEATGGPIPDVEISAESIEAYHRHWRYALGFKRRARTDSKGRFRLGGLAPTAQNLVLEHPSFGTRYEHGVEAGSMDLTIAVPSAGGIHGSVTGLRGRPPGGLVTVRLETVEAEGASPHRAEKVPLGAGDTFELPGILPGRYVVTVRAGTRASPPQPVEVRKTEATRVAFHLQEGATLYAEVAGPGGEPIDPAYGEVLRGTEGRQAVAQLVSRRGRFDAEGLPEGTFRLRVTAEGHVPVESAPFELRSGATTSLMRTAGPLRLARYGYIRLRSVRTRSGGPPEGPVVVRYRIDGDDEWNRLMQGTMDIPVAPGTLEVEAHVQGTDETFAGTYEVAPGRTTQLDVDFSAR